MHTSQDTQEIREFMARLTSGDPSPAACFQSMGWGCRCKNIVWPLSLGDTVEWAELAFVGPKSEGTLMCQGVIVRMQCIVYTETPRKGSLPVPPALAGACCFDHLHIRVQHTPESWARAEGWGWGTLEKERGLWGWMVQRLVQQTPSPQEFGPLFGGAS